MADNVRELPGLKQGPSTMDERLHPEDGIVKFWWWVTSRAFFGPWLVMQAAGMLHLDVSQSIPNLSIGQSASVTAALMVVAYFFRR